MIELSHVQKIVGERTVVNIEALALGAGEVDAVIGPVGSGKSALLDLLVGQSRPTAGTVRVAGLDPARDRDQLARQIGVLFAENGLYDRLSARVNLTLHCGLRGLPSGQADEVLLEVGLSDHAATPAGRLPHDLARRLAFGRAILHRPAVLVLVEPFAGCDDISCALLARLIRQRAGEGATVLILAAEAVGLTDLCQTIHRMEQGRIVRSHAAQEDQQADLPFKIPVRLEGQVMLLNPSEVLYASAEEGRAWLHTADDHFPTHFTLNELEQRLVPRGFFRAHRGYLVNLQRVQAVIPYTRDSFTLVLDDSARTEIPLSKTSARELRELLGY